MNESPKLLTGNEMIIHTIFPNKNPGDNRFIHQNQSHQIRVVLLDDTFSSCASSQCVQQSRRRWRRAKHLLCRCDRSICCRCRRGVRRPSHRRWLHDPGFVRRDQLDREYLGRIAVDRIVVGRIEVPARTPVEAVGRTELVAARTPVEAVARTEWVVARTPVEVVGRTEWVAAHTPVEAVGRTEWAAGRTPVDGAVVLPSRRNLWQTLSFL